MISFKKYTDIVGDIAKKLSLVIKDYFDGIEKIIKKNKEVMSSIFYGYVRSKRQTDNAWDEQIVNNI